MNSVSIILYNRAYFTSNHQYSRSLYTGFKKAYDEVRMYVCTRIAVHAYVSQSAYAGIYMQTYMLQFNEILICIHLLFHAYVRQSAYAAYIYFP